tara:strand:- start:1038 stop:1331 length:294 start_codon:yes stop_codon:yes gene_type:complete
LAGTRKKRVKKKEEISDACLEIDGWKVGDIVWGMTLGKEILHGEIKTLHDVEQVYSKSPGASLGKAVTIMVIGDGKYRTVGVSTLSETKIKKPRVKK